MPMPMIRMVTINCQGPARALPAGPEADALFAADAEGAAGRVELLGFPRPISTQQLVQALSKLGARFKTAQVSRGLIEGSGEGLACVSLIERGPNDARALAAHIAAALGADNSVHREAPLAPSGAELAAIFESWDLERASPAGGAAGNALRI